MYYELYIDAFFLVNTIMNYFILLIVRKLLRCTATRRNVLFGSVIGSILTCIIIVLPSKSVFLKLLLLQVGINLITVVLALKIRKIQLLIKAVPMFFIITFIFGGMLQWYSGISSKPLDVTQIAILGAGCYCVLSIGIYCFHSYKKKKESLLRVTIMKNEVKKDMIGLIDTGNSLFDPISGKPVSIVSLEEVKGLLSSEMFQYLESFYQNKGITSELTYFDELSSISYVPFHSVGRKNGMMPALIMDRMLLKKETGSHLIKNPMFAICENNFIAKDKYQIILNPSLTDY